MAKAVAKAPAPVSNKAPPKAPGKSVAIPVKKKQEIALPTEAFEQFASAGMENVTSKDLVIPRLTILQDLSPQLKKQKPEYIEGAEVGNFCNVATSTVFESMKLIPCFYQRVLLEWAPRDTNKGLVHNHGSDNSILDQCEQDEKRRQFLPNGNQIIETMTFFCLDVTSGLAERVFVPLSSTQLKNGRKWMTMLSAEKLQRADGSVYTPPLFFRAWDVTSADESNASGDWKGWRFEAAETIVEIDPTQSLLREAVEYYKQSASGAMIVDPSPLPTEIEDAQEM